VLIEVYAPQQIFGGARLMREQNQTKDRCYWFDDIFMHDGYAWATELIEREMINKKIWDCKPLCLGMEAEIVPILKGNQPIPDHMHPRRKAILETIVKEKSSGRDQAFIGRSGMERKRTPRTLRYRQKDSRRVKARKRLSRR
jgi:hypothetical protein